MAHDPAKGVVDENCRVHGTENLFVVGSSVFPTPGSDTPTLTVVALALRLASHLKSVFASLELAANVSSITSGRLTGHVRTNRRLRDADNPPLASL
jgi:hypothetical protein